MTQPFFAPTSAPRLCLAATCLQCPTDAAAARPSVADAVPTNWQSLLSSGDAMATLRRLLIDDETGSTVSRLTDHEVLARAGRLLERGSLRICRGRARTREARGSGGAAAPRAEAPPPPVRRRVEAVERHWIEIRLVDEDRLPVARERYALRLPDGSLREGQLDHNGCVFLDDLPAGACQVSFPDIDAREWRAA